MFLPQFLWFGARTGLHGPVCTERVSGILGPAGAVHVSDYFRCSIAFSFHRFVVGGCWQRVQVQLCQVHLGDLDRSCDL